MIVLTRFMKAPLLITLSLLISLSALGQSSFATNLQGLDINDFTVQKDQEYKVKYSAGDLDVLQVNDLNRMSFIKFDISELLGHSIKSAKLQLFGSGNGTVNLFYVSDDDWVNEMMAKSSDDTSGVNLASKLTNQIGQKTINQNSPNAFYDIDFDNLDDLKANISSSDKYFSVALVANQNYDHFLFYSRENPEAERPVLIAAPVPEPSSMALGFLGLGSILGLRRRKQNKFPQQGEA